jgi:choline-sulfatase
MQQPNILIVFTDQQRADTIAALGNDLIHTPNFDRLCREGTAFTDCSTPSPVCVSARCSLATGHLPAVTGVCDNGDVWRPGTRTNYQGLTDAGYRTHAVGKCHFVPDELWGLQSRETQDEIAAADGDDYRRHLSSEGFGWCLEPNGMRGDWYYLPQPSQLPEALHPTTWVADRSCAFIAEQAASDRPWLLGTHIIHPHPPFSPPYPWSRLYQSHTMPPALEAENDVSTWVNHVQNRSKWRDAGHDRNLLRTMKAAYWACISFIDHQLGRMLAALEDSGQLESTLILLTSDHGEHLGDLGFFGKRSFHDAALRVPMLARLPERFAPGGRCAAPASLVDVAPTLASLAGVDPDPNWPGLDLASLAAGAERPRPVTSQFARGQSAQHCLVETDWKYAWSAGDGREYLFDRQADPHNLKDLASDPGQHKRLAAMRDRLRAELPAEEAGVGGWPQYPPIELPSDPDDGLMFQPPPGMHAQVDAIRGQ